MSPSPATVKKVEVKNFYPSPMATHEEVVNKPELFFDTLKSFHSVMGTKFMVPVIGRKELDLHVLYVEVTRRGGYDKVVHDKKWREISLIFNFSATTTSASFVLKRHYHSLLYQYEQVYFFNLQGPVSSSPPAQELPHGRYACGPHVGDHEEHTSKDVPDSPDEDTGSRSFTAVGTIDGKFDCGYLVTVKLGNDVLHGVLYHPNEPSVPSTPVEDLSMAIVPYNPGSSHRRSSRMRKHKRKRWGRDPNHPKPNRSGYNFFFAEKHSVLKSIYPHRERDFTKMIGESWNNLSPEEREVYQNLGLRDKERYRRELKAYHESLAGTIKSKED